MDKPIAESCLRNQQAIFEVLSEEFGSEQISLLELGSGTGQHAAYITQRLPHITWQPTDLIESLSGIQAWRECSKSAAMLPPAELDVNKALPEQMLGVFDSVFCANTVHFVSDETAINILATASAALKSGGSAYLYGPLNENGEYTSEGNSRLDEWLQSRDPASGIKDRQWVCAQAQRVSMRYQKRIAMPANNWILVFTKK